MSNLAWILIIVLLVYLLYRFSHRFTPNKNQIIIDNYLEIENEYVERGQPAQLKPHFIQATKQLKGNDLAFLLQRDRDFLDDNQLQLQRAIEASLAAFEVPQPRPPLRAQPQGQSLVAPKKSPPKKQTLETLKSLEQVKSDSQNVHDTSVNEHLRRTWKKIMHEGASIEDLEKDPKLTSIGKEAIKRAKEAPLVFSLQSGLSSDIPTLMDVLKATWGRASNPNNKGNEQALKAGLVDALNNCSENGSTLVCTGGITARLLGSLVLLDFDPQVGQMVTSDQYKHEIMHKANKALERLIDEVSQSGGPLADYAKTFKNGSSDEQFETEKEQFKKMYSALVDEILDESNLDDQLKPKHLKEVIMECF